MRILITILLLACVGANAQTKDTTQGPIPHVTIPDIKDTTAKSLVIFSGQVHWAMVYGWGKEGSLEEGEDGKITIRGDTMKVISRIIKDYKKEIDTHWDVVKQRLQLEEALVDWINTVPAIFSKGCQWDNLWKILKKDGYRPSKVPVKSKPCKIK